MKGCEVVAARLSAACSAAQQLQMTQCRMSAICCATLFEGD